MNFSQVRLHSWAYTDPPLSFSSEEIEARLKNTYDRLKLPEGRLLLQTGIAQRGYWPLGTKPSKIASEAAERLLKNISPTNVGLLIHASVCRDFLEPATASVVHRKLALADQCMTFDLSNACLGVISASLMAASMIERGEIKAALIVSGENSGPLLLKTLQILENDPSLTRQSIKKYMASLSIGSCGVAWLLTHESLAPYAPKLKGAVTLTDSSAVELCQGGGTLEELVMETDSEELMKAGIELAQKAWQQYKVQFSRPQKMIAHQVGLIHRRGMQVALDASDIPDFVTYPTYGNTGSAALPLTFMKAMEANFFAPGDQVVLTGIGSGLVTSMLSLEIP